VVVIDSLTAQKRLAQAGFGLALVPVSSVRDELRRGLLVELDVPAMRTAIPIVAVHRRNGYLSPATCALLKLLMAEARRPAARRQRIEPPGRSAQVR
jgi:DNA-binding transcriptional LysR family regulator